MLINGQHFHTIWVDKPTKTVKVIDQQKLPFELCIQSLKTLDDAFHAIKEMVVRGAPLIGVTAAYGICLALENAPENTEVQAFLKKIGGHLKTARPTAVNLAYAIDEMTLSLNKTTSIKEARNKAWTSADKLKKAEIDHSNSIGNYGLQIIEKIAKEKKKPVNILTHCNAGWLACIDWGTATAPIYKAHEKGIDVHIWVDETRPRNQGSKLTAFELKQMGVPHTIIADNTGGHLMQHGMVDLVIVGSDRTTATGDVCNKIGTYLKALAAYDNQIPFYAALPSSTIDFELNDGIKEIPIEIRNEEELKFFEGKTANGIGKVETASPGSRFANYGFDVTPARLITGLITEKGICSASKKSIYKLFEKKS